jgi:hypothetical protein
MPWLRDFWFPMALTVAGIVAGVAATYSEGIPRRLWWSGTVIALAIAVLSYIWGDPVRGPFAKLLDPKSSDDFTLHAGIPIMFPIAQLKDGVDFSDVIGLQNDPIHVRVSRRWLGSMRYDIRLSTGLALTNDTVKGLPRGWDINADDNGVEVVDAHGEPMFQLVQTSNYDVYITAVLWANDRKSVTMVNNNAILIGYPAGRLTANDFPKPIFKHPAAINRGKRL